MWHTCVVKTSFSYKYQSSFSGIGIYLFSLDIFKNEIFMEAWVADRGATLMETAASSSNSKLPAILIIPPNDYHLLQK